MKTLDRRHFLKVAATAAVAAVPFRAPAPATLLEVSAGLCLVLAVGATAVTCVVRMCRPKYSLYFKIDENKTTNAGREFICLSCSRAEVQNRELTWCDGPFNALASCERRATLANTNYQAAACGSVNSPQPPPLRASITVQTTHTPGNAASWQDAAPAQVMDLNDPNTDDPSVTFTLPLSDKPTFFRASAVTV